MGSTRSVAEIPVSPDRVLLVASSGGHLAQLMRLRPWWEQRTRAWVTFDLPDALGWLEDEEDVTWAHHPTVRSVKNLVRNSFQARRVMKRFRPTVVISTGAAVALPYFMLARAQGILTIYIEVFDRIDTPTLSARLVSPFTDLMLTQWPEQQDLYNNSIEVGPLL